MKNGKQVCRFGYPKALQSTTTLNIQDDKIELVTARNDPLVNSYNPIQLCSWRANVDMQYCYSRRKVIEYCSKYATKSEPRSQPLKDTYKKIVSQLDDNDRSLKAVQKLLISSVGERDYSSQETCHLLLQLPLYITTRDFIILSLDGSRAVDDKLDPDKPATVPSILDNYRIRPSSSQFESMTLLHFAQHFSNPRNHGGEPNPRQKKVVVVVRPYISPEPNGPQYEQYCKQKLMLHKPFRQDHELMDTQDTFAKAYEVYLMSENVPQSIQDDVQRLLDHNTQDDTNDGQNTADNTSHGQNEHTDTSDHQNFHVEDWMLICQHRMQVDETSQNQTNPDFDWCEAGRQYPNLHEAAQFITQHREHAHATAESNNTTYDPQRLQGKQLQVYNQVLHHAQHLHLEPLRIIVSGTAGTGKSFLIGCLAKLLQPAVKIMAPTGVAAFNVHGYTLHSLLHLPTRGEFKDLQGESLNDLQKSMNGVKYIIIDEISMVGRKMFGQIDKRLRQAFPQNANYVFGGCSCILFGDFGQLPPVMDHPLFLSGTKTALSDLGRAAYLYFNQAVVLTQVMRQQGQQPEQIKFRNILMRLRNGQITTEDWQHLLTRSAAHVSDLNSFENAIHLYPRVDDAVQYNLFKLRQGNSPIAQIKALHSGPAADKASAEDAGGLQPFVHLAQHARVMLTSNLWVDVGLVNGATGTVQAICYQNAGPPALPTVVMVSFDSYSGPTLPNGTVPIVPIRRSWSSTNGICSRLQLPLKLSWAITIHKSQGLTLDKAVIEIGEKEFCTGLTFVACSRVRHLKDIVFETPFTYQRLSNLSKSVRFHERCQEDARLLQLDHSFTVIIQLLCKLEIFNNCTNQP